MFSLRPRPSTGDNNRKTSRIENKSESTDSFRVMDKPSQFLLEDEDIDSKASVSQSCSTRATSFGTSLDSTQSWPNLFPKFRKTGESRTHVSGLSFDLLRTAPLHRAMQLSGILEDIPPDVPDHADLGTTPHSHLTFSRQKVTPCSNQPSALSALLNAPSAPIVNPFSDLKASAEPSPDIDAEWMDVRVYFPHAEDPMGEAITLHVWTEVKVAGLMGLALWTYWEKAWMPQLSVNHTDNDTLHRYPHTLTNTVTPLSNWCLRLVRDGFVDYENEAPDASDRVRLLGSHEYALLIRSETAYGDGVENSRRKSWSECRHRRFSIGPRLPSVKRYSHSRGASLPFQIGTNPVVPIKSFYVKTTGDERPIPIECSIYASINDVLNTVCDKQSIKHPELYMLMTQSVRKVLLAVPHGRNVSSFEDNTEFVLALKSNED